LANETEQKASGEIDEQGSVRKSSAHADLYYPLQAVSRERANRAEEGNQEDFQRVPLSFGGSTNKKLLAPRGSQESSAPMRNIGAVMANSIAFREKCSVTRLEMEAAGNGAVGQFGF